MLLTRAPLYLPGRNRVFPFDLHVLGTPPAFILSQDQTLQLYSKNKSCLKPKSLLKGPDFIFCHYPVFKDQTLLPAVSTTAPPSFREPGLYTPNKKICQELSSPPHSFFSAYRKKLSSVLKHVNNTE